MVQIKRVYAAKEQKDGVRILVDRLWPRGLTKERAAVDVWMKEVAPSTELRKWFGHDPERWGEFQVRYRKELRGVKGQLDELRRKCKAGMVTLLFGAKDEEHNEARVLKALLERKKR
jgi:uncharacterized protein YeaO (DUF488 family)